MAAQLLVVHRKPADGRAGIAIFCGRRFIVRLGRSGLASRKREGDGATPIGDWPVLRILYRPDRAARPRSSLPVDAIAPADGWCDAPFDANYNRPVALPYAASAEALWRADHLYDLMLVIDYNSSRRRHGKGSAIFLHLMRDEHTPTEGCIAFREADLRFVLARLRPGDRVRVGR